MPLHSETLPRRKWSIRFLVFVLVVFFCNVPAYAQQSEINSLAAKAASAINDALMGTTGKRLVMVSISEPKTGPTELGAKLTEEFAAALAARGILLMSNTTLQQTAQKEHVLPDALRDPGTFRCVASDAGADVAVNGTVQPVDEDMELLVAAVRTEDATVFLKDKIRFAVTPDITKLQSETLPAPSVSNGIQKPTSGIPEAGKNGYTTPVCLYCPNPQYSDRAFVMQEQGTITFDAVIGSDGKAYSLTVLHGLSCGINQETLNFIENVYKFKAAAGPDGKPAAVHLLFEVNFRLYDGR